MQGEEKAEARGRKSPCEAEFEVEKNPLSPTTTDQEEVAGNYPVTHKQVLFMLTASMSSMLCGVMNGWTAVLPRLQEDHSRFTITDQEVAWLVSMTSLVMIACSLVCGVLVEWIGPRRVLQLSQVMSATCWLLMAFAPYKWLLYLGRAIGSISFAFIITSSQPLIAEMTSTSIRGLASTVPEVLAAVGVLFGFFLAAFFSWDMATLLSALPPIILMLPTAFMPESPYWLVRRGRTEDARNSLAQLMGPKADVDKELYILSRAPTATQTSCKEQFVEMRKGRNLRPVLLVMSIFILREFGGRSPIFQYTVYIFIRSGVDLDPFTCSLILGVVRVACSCVSAGIIDRVGRRLLILSSALLCGVAQGVVGLSLYLALPGMSWVPLLALMVYVGGYGLGVGPVPWVYVGELLPSPVRSLGASIINFVITLTQFLINFAFLWIIGHLGLGRTLITFGVCTLMIGVVVWRWVPETRGASLQQLETAFSSQSKKLNPNLTAVVCEEKSSLTQSDDVKKECIEKDDWKGKPFAELTPCNGNAEKST